jgi:ATP-dependent DNA helicase RecG
MDGSRKNSRKIGHNDPVGDPVERPGCPAGKWGTGTLSIIDWFTDNGNPEPECWVDVNSVALLFYPVPARPESQLESQLEPRPESLRDKVITLLSKEMLSKSEISRKLGQKRASGQLNRVIKDLIKEGVLSYTIPEKLQSPDQKYRLAKSPQEKELGKKL